MQDFFFGFVRNLDLNDYFPTDLSVGDSVIPVRFLVQFEHSDSMNASRVIFFPRSQPNRKEPAATGISQRMLMLMSYVSV